MTTRPLTAAQKHWLIELLEPNENGENEWRVGGHAARACQALVERGLAKKHQTYSHTQVFSLTPAGRHTALKIKNRCPRCKGKGQHAHPHAFGYTQSCELCAGTGQKDKVRR